ncbi:MAG: 50S ribosomal protein L21 [Chloroflexi bacterium OLB15]|nr:MAG: 50S ribosomal protein L21 [Chloroflexi bacterium OLB15]
MAIDRNGRVLAASILFLLAILLVTNYVVSGAELLTYALPLGLVLLGLLILFIQTPKRRSAAKASEDSASAPAPNLREYLPPDSVISEEAPAAPVLELPIATDEIPETPKPEAEPEIEGVPYALLRDDLVVIDGIGPKIAGALYEAGITTYGKLADETPESLQAVLSAAGVRVVGRVEASLPTWPYQARFAAQGDFPGLMRYIAEHKRSSSED